MIWISYLDDADRVVALLSQSASVQCLMSGYRVAMSYPTSGRCCDWNSHCSNLQSPAVQGSQKRRSCEDPRGCSGYYSRASCSETKGKLGKTR